MILIRTRSSALAPLRPMLATFGTLWLVTWWMGTPASITWTMGTIAAAFALLYVVAYAHLRRNHPAALRHQITTTALK